MSENNSNAPNNTYKLGNTDNVYSQTVYFTVENKTPYFFRIFQVPTDVKEAIYLTYGGGIK